MTEQEYVVDQFHKAFGTDYAVPTVIYGLGKNTEAVLESLDHYAPRCNVIGLMDGRHTGEEFFGYKVFSEKEVISKNARIVIIARESVVPIIYERIAHLKDKHGIKIYDYCGTVLGEKAWSYNNLDLPYWSITEEALKREIDAHEVISFDVFDTLIMRRVLEPTDIFEIIGAEFAKIRRVEDKVDRNFDTIYERLISEHGLSKDLAEKYKKQEYELELKYIIPRKKMREMYEYALETGKRVYLISDMYFSAKQIAELLDACGYKGLGGYGYASDGIRDIEEIIVSSEYGKRKKTGELYKIYAEKLCLKNSSSIDSSKVSALHIGDDRRSDGERAVENGIDSFLIYSAYEMWMASSMQRSLVSVDSLRKRLLLGQLVSHFCENPFALADTKGVIGISTPADFGYLIGNLYSEYVLWLKQVMQTGGYEYLLLPSRDGYLIKNILDGSKEKHFQYDYVKASRRAVSVAAIRCEDDIVMLAKRKYNGTLAGLLENRFGIECDSFDVGVLAKSTNDISEEELIESVLLFKEQILLRAEQERKEYLAYLQQFKNFESTGGSNKTEAELAIFDFIASGTVQYYLQRLISKDFKGVYFATMNHPKQEYMLEGKVEAAYGNITSYGSGTAVGKYYLMLEPIMTDGYNTLRCIQNGDFVYEPDDNTVDIKKAYSTISAIQLGIEDYCSDAEEYVQTALSNAPECEFADKFFGTVVENGCEIADSVKEALFNDDIFDGIKVFRRV